MPLQNAERLCANCVLHNIHAINSNLAYFCSRISTVAQTFPHFFLQHIYFFFFFFFGFKCFSTQIKTSAAYNCVWQLHWRYSFRLHLLSLKSPPLCVDAAYESKHVFSYFACVTADPARLSRLDSVTDCHRFDLRLLKCLVGTSRIRLICTNNEGIFNVLMRPVDVNLQCSLSQNN